MANTVFTAGSPILRTIEMMVTGRLIMLGIELIGYTCVLLLFTAVQYACLLTDLKA